MQVDDPATPVGTPINVNRLSPDPTSKSALATDRGQASRATFTMNSQGLDKGLVRHPRPVREPSTPSNSTQSDSPAKSSIHGYTKACGVAKSNSTASTGTHISVPVIGNIPYGTLQVHRVSDSPQSPAVDSVTSDPMAGGDAAQPPPPPPKCLESGDCFVILDLPEKFTIGLDTMALTADGKKFMGFRDIPPGPHFLWLSEPGAISRCGYWFVTGPRGEVRVKQWDRYNEVLGEAASQFEVRENKKNIDATYPRLIPYNVKSEHPSTAAPPPPPPKDQPRRSSDPDPDFTADSTLIWRQLTFAITPSFLNRITGKRTVTEWLVDTTDGAKGDIQFKDSTKLLKSIVGSQLDFLFQQDIIDLQLLNLAAGEQSVTDTSSRILVLLGQTGDNNKFASKRSSTSSTATQGPIPLATEGDIIAELQFTFLTGLHLGNYTCIEQWWHLLLKIILRAHQLVLSHPEFTRSLLQTFHAQMVYNDRYIDHASAANDPSNDTDPYRTAASAGSANNADSSNSILEAIPRNKAKLRATLTNYKRRLNQALLGERNNISAEQGAVGHAFADLEAWFWKYGWDLRSDYVQGEEGREGVSADAAASKRRLALSDADSDEEMGEYAPVIVNLDENGREVGLVNWDGK